MKKYIYTISILAILFSCTTNKNTRSQPIYDSSIITSSIINVMNENLEKSNTSQHWLDKTKFKDNNFFSEFFIIDLADTTNVSWDDYKIDFEDLHVYYFSPFHAKYRNDNFLVLKNEETHFFRDIRKNEIDALINFIKKELSPNEPLIKNIEKYEEFGAFYFW